MITVKIPYAKTYLEAEIPDNRLQGILLSKAHSYKATDSEQDIVRQALENPIASPRLSQLAQNKKNIVIITSDHTRPVPSSIISPLIIEEIRKTNPDGKITFLIATGFHRASTPEELACRSGDRLTKEITSVMHDCRAAPNMITIGKLHSCDDTVVNKLAM